MNLDQIEFWGDSSTKPTPQTSETGAVNLVGVGVMLFVAGAGVFYPVGRKLRNGHKS